MKRVAQSISGGMDSTCLALRHLSAGSHLHLLSFDYGQDHRLELDRLDMNIKLWQERGLSVEHKRLAVPFGALAKSSLTSSDVQTPEGFYAEESMKLTVVPNRNAIFASLAYAYALSIATEHDCEVALSLGVHSGDHAIYPDCRPEFFTALHEAFVLGNWGGEKVVLDLPYLHFDKAAILRDALLSCSLLELDFDEVLANTSTSYAPTADGLASGKTGSDVERILAFHEIGRVDPVAYVGGWDAALAFALDSQAAYTASN